ncbi:MAG: hypothetical protein IJ527_00810 [Prevotella sp.]|nr:hypothetical protein [Prevotella sp.]
MKTRHLFLAVASVMLTGTTMPAQAQSQGLTNPVFDFATDGGYYQTWELMPLKTDLERAGLHGNVVKVEETLQGSDISRNYNEQKKQTATFNQQGNLMQIREPRTSFMNPKKKLNDAVTDYEYDENGRLKKYTYKTDAEYSNGVRPQQHVHTIYYNAQQKPEKEIYRAFSYEDGKWGEFSSSPDEPSWTRTYNQNGELAGGLVARSYPATFNAQGLLTELKLQSTPSTKFKWDEQGRCVSVTAFTIDGMDEEEYYEINKAISYNEKGNIAKIVFTYYICKSNWKRIKKERTETYTVKYVYDAQDNWTKATINMLQGKKSKLYETITRVITYGE